MATLDDLERLARLRERGMLSEDEFESEKRKLLTATSFTKEVHSTAGQPADSQSYEDPLNTPLPKDQRGKSSDRTEPSSVSPAEPAAMRQKSGSGSDDSKDVLQSKSGSGKTLRRIVYAVLILAGVYFLPVILSKMPGKEAIRKAVIQRPEPVVVWHRCNDDDASLFEYRVTVKGKVRNTGAAGYVTILATVTQGSHEYRRRDRRYLRSDEEADVSFTLDEPEAGGDNIKCDVSAIGSE